MVGKKNLDDRTRNLCVQFLLEHVNRGKPAYGRLKLASERFGVSGRTVAQLWSEAMKQKSEGLPILMRNKKSGLQRPRVSIDLELMMSVEVGKRGTIRKLAKAISVSKSTVGRWKMLGLFRSHTNAIKPDLNAPNKLFRLQFSLQALEVDKLLNRIKFKSMQNVIHMDEKWFNITKHCSRYYLAPGEEEPYRSCKSKKYITKVMFECAVGRPMFDESGELLFDGKIGIFPLVEKEPAKRNSKNRPKGTLVTKPIESITKEVMKDCLINQVIPAIKAKWPSFASKDIIIQQDNEKPHISNHDPDFRAAASSDGFNIILVQQPSNSPDTNVNDLGFFRAIQSLQDSISSYSADELIKAVEDSYDDLTACTLNKVFLSLQACMVEIMKFRGHNKYRLPHMKKDRLIREGRLPVNLEVDETLVRDCIDYLTEAGETMDLRELMEDLGYALE